VSPRDKQRYFTLRKEGFSIAGAAREVGVSRSTANRFEDAAPANGNEYLRARQELDLPKPYTREELAAKKPAALRALDDFAFWRYRYLGRTSTPWQEEAAHRILDWLASDGREHVVENCPPGSGKTTKWSDICTWLICRDRTIRIIWLSSTTNLASQSVNRVRRALERTRPIQDADACLAAEYGRFRPEAQDLWRREQFTVMGLDATPTEDKEPTMAAYGMESEFLGHRGNLVIGDDLVTGKLLRTIDSIENQQRWWSEEGETRAEPGGVIVVNGQRMGPRDLYNYCLAQKQGDSDDPRYQHILYPAHFDDRCAGERNNPDHKIGAPSYPDGCLLDSTRIPWTDLTTMRRNNPSKYAVQYQQQDLDPAGVLVPQIWIDGGRDSSGYEYPGCWDTHRGLAEIPKGLSPPVYSIASADPSPTKYWSIQWWLYHPASEQRFLMDLIKQSMDAPDFLDFNINERQFFGIMEDWQRRSKTLGYPISTWVVENNAAQRFMLQYDHVKRWQALHGVHVVGHSTTARNKLDAEYGVQMLANLYRFGNVRLPGLNTIRSDTGLKDPGRYASMKLIEEVTKYDGTGATTDDCIMAQWFFEYHLQNLIRARAEKQPRAWRPSFMKVTA
jgi:hypothetical protein